MAKKLTVMIPDNLHTKLKVLAAVEGTSITNLVIGAIERLDDPKLTGRKNYFIATHEIPVKKRPAKDQEKLGGFERDEKVKKFTAGGSRVVARPKESETPLV